MTGVQRRVGDLLREWQIAQYREHRVHDERLLLRHRDLLGAYGLDFYCPGEPTPVGQSLTAAGLPAWAGRPHPAPSAARG